MKGIFAILAFAGVAMGHNVLTHLHINGVADPSCVRQAVSTDPLIDITSNNMACNIVKGNAKNKCTVKAGDNVALEWRADPNIAPADYPLKDGTIPVGVTDDSHKGPCAVYMKKVDDSSNAVGAGDGWFKIEDDGLVGGVFCTDRLREANAPQPAKIPGGIAPGDYLMRAEFLTLNNAGPASMGGAQQPQFYAGCVQVTVEGTSGALTPQTVSIPGYVTMDTPGLIFDIWNSPNGLFSNYPVVGPAPISDNDTGSPSPPASSATPSIKTSSTKAPVRSSRPTATVAPVKEVITTSAPTYPASPDASAVTPVPTSDCSVSIVTATTFITLTATTTVGQPSATPDSAESSDAEPDIPRPTSTRGYRGSRGHGVRGNRL